MSGIVPESGKDEKSKRDCWGFLPEIANRWY